ncbi:hypothetical protein CLOBY_18210 [Clostridium saccharobutylicum]|uniref:DUF2577 family protein n=1 Tax=Clostridium saccharobutylicum TaxID=169679 RepID=UPI000983C515|nr:DUF2577 family protein [Clostridium saccharobutylicum]AQS09690.1 hypothetical protein CLOBY_18210 [Clostridium saccharobutylicum]MBC2436916.1 DUF2577 family protein [Clostridium saccharobutylicum]NSB89264.1 hypothetical protein [Clostridium saccharobutylicum]NYC27918.1 hypothetical protein [Clostridium saccharobutylicum]OOM17115.1 hypothetical protein CLSAB_20630 [Clostridium saccharobutylicum]
MEDYRVGFQKLFNERNNEEQSKFYIADVIQVSPLKVSIMNGQAYFTDGQNLKVCESLKTIAGTIVIDEDSHTFSISREINIGDKILCYPLDNVNFIAYDKL